MQKQTEPLNAHVLIVGFGDLARRVLLQLYSDSNDYRISIIARDKERAMRDINLVRFLGLNLGHHKEVQFYEADLEDEDVIADLLSTLDPDLIFNTASIQSWRMITQLPKAIFDDLDTAQLGPWLPVHLSPALHLMRAVRSAGYKGPVANAAFPDAVNPVLAKVGLSPTCGIGNTANIIPALRYSLAIAEGTSPEDVQIKLVTQHFFSHYAPRSGDTGGAPYQCWASVHGRYTDRPIGLDELLPPLTGALKRTGGVEGQALTASSAVLTIRGLLSKTPIAGHAPGPNGLLGGYPVIFENAKVRLNLPSGCSSDDAIETNLACQRYDGIEAIADNGDVTFGGQQCAVLLRLIGHNGKKMRLKDTHEMAYEMADRYQAFARRVSQNLAA